jgi:hypothetical protein
MFRPTLEPTQPPIQLVPTVLCSVLKQMGRESDHSPHLVTRLRMSGDVPPLLHMPSCSAQGVFTFYCVLKVKFIKHAEV